MAEDEHRDKRRERVLEGASIVTGIADCEGECAMRSMHRGGEFRIIAPGHKG